MDSKSNSKGQSDVHNKTLIAHQPFPSNQHKICQTLMTNPVLVGFYQEFILISGRHTISLYGNLKEKYIEQLSESNKVEVNSG